MVVERRGVGGEGGGVQETYGAVGEGRGGGGGRAE